MVVVLRVLHSAWVYNPICPYECVKTSDLCWKTAEEAYRPAKMASDYGMNLLQSSWSAVTKPCCTTSCLFPTLVVCHIHRAKPWIMYAVFQDMSAGAGWVTADGKRSGGVSVRSPSDVPSCFRQGHVSVACNSLCLVEQMTNVGCCHMMTTEVIILTHLTKWDV